MSDLYVANCGPAVGISYEEILKAFGKFGEVKKVSAGDGSGSRVIVSFGEAASAQAALQAWGDATPCHAFAPPRTLHIRYSTSHPPPKSPHHHPDSVSLSAAELQVPGIHLLLDFVTHKEQEELLAAVDARPWNNLAKRRVQHYGYEFLYETRNVDVKDHQGELPSFVNYLRKRISSFSGDVESGDILVNQLTVNEYPPGVGLSPHIDTHSAFEGSIFSLSLAGPCIMEFRKYSQGLWLSPSIQPMVLNGNNPEFMKKTLFLPPRSMLLLSGEGRYAWHHYIPHHKVDTVRGKMVKRASRRVSFTFRKVRNGACSCTFPQYCDSQNGGR